MFNSKRNKFTAKVTAGLLMIGAMIISIPAFADEVIVVPKTSSSEEPLDTPTGTAEDLEGITVKNSSQWTWGVGGQSEIVTDNLEEQPAYEADPSSNQIITPSTIQEENKEWQQTNAGDPPATSAGIPIVNF